MYAYVALPLQMFTSAMLCTLLTLQHFLRLCPLQHISSGPAWGSPIPAEWNWDTVPAGQFWRRGLAACTRRRQKWNESREASADGRRLSQDSSGTESSGCSWPSPQLLLSWREAPDISVDFIGMEWTIMKDHYFFIYNYYYFLKSDSLFRSWWRQSSLILAYQTR